LGGLCSQNFGYQPLESDRLSRVPLDRRTHTMDNVARPCETFPSAPNWFGAAISAVCSSLELYVYASRNRVIALNSNTLRVQNSFIASQHKLHAIAIHGTICATTGQDKAVRCWNLDNCKLENGHLRHQVMNWCWLLSDF
jgi:hypothetical protein